MKTATANHSLRILHVSDLHARGPRERSRFSRSRVLGEEWQRNLDAVQADCRIDLVCFTGDVADWGQPAEYEAAARFVSELLEKLELRPEQFFVVPGNHDVNRAVAVKSWARLRTAFFALDRDELSRWLCRETKPPFGLHDADRDAVLSRCAAYREWLSSMGRADLLPNRSPHGTLGYRARLDLPRLPFSVHIIGFDSAWLCGGDDDAEHLWLTHDQLGRLCSTPTGERLDGFRIGLVHHPLSYFADEQDARAMLLDGIDLLLRGHVHAERFEGFVEPDGTLQILAAGCLYESDQRDRWPNACHLVDVTLDSIGRPLSYDVRFRSWSKNGFWHDDSSLYRGTENGRLSVKVGGGLRSGNRYAGTIGAVAQVEYIGAGGIVERRDLARGDTLSVGRAREMDIVFNDEFVSARHARFVAAETGLRVTDNNSKNKVFVNEVEVKGAALKVGDEVRLGKKGPMIKVVEALAATETEEPQ